MKTWCQLLVRHGWQVEEKGKNVFDCKKETEENLDFLEESLKKGSINYSLLGGQLVIHDAPLEEALWIQILDYNQRGMTEGGFREKTEPIIRILDTYIAGIVRQFNRLGFYTALSCDGHEKRPAMIYFVKEIDLPLLKGLLRVMGVPRVSVQETYNHYIVRMYMNRTGLLEVAEKLSLVSVDWLEKGVEYIEEQLLYADIEELLSIPGVSGKESNVRDVVKKRLTPFVDRVTEDYYGNLLAEKTYGRGNGPVILLNAHLDTVRDFTINRRIIKDESLWYSSEGILGADDRAGVAILLSMARFLNQSDFSGKVKFLFTVEEEVGLVGARQVEEYFLWGVEAGIVLDRRGSGDIVTSCRGEIPFCGKEYGRFFERVAKESGLNGWACTEGGSSDTRIWAEHGIQSVNLSVGYHNEHSERECLDIRATYQTYTLLKNVFQKAKELRNVLRKDFVANGFYYSGYSSRRHQRIFIKKMERG